MLEVFQKTFRNFAIDSRTCSAEASDFNRLTSKRDHVLFYRCRNVRQTVPRKPDLEIVEAGFFALDDLPKDTTAATHRRLAELSGKLPPADFW